MRQYHSHSAVWGIALLTVTSLGGHRVAAWDWGIFFGSRAAPAPPVIVEHRAPPWMPVQDEIEVLSRGPVHEAFAEPVSLEVHVGLIAPAEPPPNIEEIPPPERPQGQQFAWIPGYWSWDADRNGYIWVSACWRAAPPSMSWMPGYWARVPGGWEWVAGFWAPAGVRELEYLPPPPAIANVEPHSSPASSDAIWVPPCMRWSHGQYVLRAGYWLVAHPNWVWVPSHYVRTPRGYIFAAGHWDYSLERRGVLFAPVYFPASIHRRPNFAYSPSIVLDLGLLRVNLFAYPRYSHYYFGDYYDDAYLSIGIYPWFDSRRHRTWYDPIYEHDRWQNQRSEPRWEERGRDDYNRLRADRDLRPARTYREQESRLAKLPEPQRRSFRVAQPVTVAVVNRQAPVKFERINDNARQKISRQAGDVRTFRDERNRWESTAASPRTVQPSSDRNRAVTPPPQRREAPPLAVRRETAPVPHREANVPQPERVQIPVPPVASRSGLQGIFQKGPPSRPSDEDKGKDGKDDRGNKNTRDDRDKRHGD